MRVVRVAVRGFRAIRDFDKAFDREHQVIIGRNGCGKTTLLNLIAMAVGSDAARTIYDGEAVDHFGITVSVNDREYTHVTKHRLDATAFDEFKASLPTVSRINFALDEYYSDALAHGRIDIDTVEAMLDRYTDREKLKTGQVFGKRGRDVVLGIGDGSRQAIRLCLCAAMPDGPLLMDQPDRHMHIVIKRMMGMMFARVPQQVISVSHDPEWVSSRMDSVFSM